MKEYVEATLGVDPWHTEQCLKAIGGPICRAMLFDTFGSAINVRDLLQRSINLLGNSIRYQALGLLLSGVWILWVPSLGHQGIRNF